MVHVLLLLVGGVVPDPDTLYAEPCEEGQLLGSPVSIAADGSAQVPGLGLLLHESLLVADLADFVLATLVGELPVQFDPVLCDPALEVLDLLKNSEVGPSAGAGKGLALPLEQLPLQPQQLLVELQVEVLVETQHLEIVLLISLELLLLLGDLVYGVVPLPLQLVIHHNEGYLLVEDGVDHLRELQGGRDH